MNGIVARFRVNRREFTLDVELNLPAQGITALFGPSGSGKTTLLRAIAGLEYHQGGYLKVDDMLWQSDKHFTPPHQRELAYVFQEACLFPHLSVRKNLEYGLKRIPPLQRKVLLDDVIALLDISHLLDRSPTTLSGGERQRAAIARALAVSPRLLLMDEPLAALDQQRKQEILPYLESLHQSLDIPVIYVSHSITEVARLADHLIILEAGHVAACGDVHELFSRLDISLSHGNDAAAIIDAVVVEHDADYALTYLEFADTRIVVPQMRLTIGSQVRLQIAARDVSLTLQHQSHTSILNIFPATVDAITNEGQSQVTVRLLVNGAPLLSRITRKSAVLLDLHPSKHVFAQAKSIAMLS